MKAIELNDLIPWTSLHHIVVCPWICDRDCRENFNLLKSQLEPHGRQEGRKTWQTDMRTQLENGKYFFQ